MSYSPNHPDLTTWLSIDASTDFPVQNLPFGIFSTEDRSERPGVAIGQYILDLRFLEKPIYSTLRPLTLN